MSWWRTTCSSASTSKEAGCGSRVGAESPVSCLTSKEQEREGFSIPAQQRLLNSYADDRCLTVVREFVDVETAKRAGRTSFTKMLAWLKKNRDTCRTILVEKTDRLYRNLKDWVVLDELDLEIHLVKEGIVLSDDARSTDKFMHGIRVLMAKNYIDNLSEEATPSSTIVVSGVCVTVKLSISSFIILRLDFLGVELNAFNF